MCSDSQASSPSPPSLFLKQLHVVAFALSVQNHTLSSWDGRSVHTQRRPGTDFLAPHLLPGLLELELISAPVLLLILTLQRELCCSLLLPSQWVPAPCFSHICHSPLRLPITSQVSDPVLCVLLGFLKDKAHPPQGTHLPKLRRGTTYTRKNKQCNNNNDRKHYLSTHYVPGMC